LVVYTEDEFAKEWVSAIFRSDNSIANDAIEVYAMGGDGTAVNANKYHNLDPSSKTKSICIIDGDSKQKDNPEVNVYRLPGEEPELCVFNQIMDKLDSCSGILSVRFMRKFEEQGFIKNIIEEIDSKIKDLFSKQTSIGIPLYSISKVAMFKIGYFSFEDIPSEGYIAVKAVTDKMLPLLGIDDIAVIHLQESIIDGQTVLLLIDNSYYDIAKIFSEANTCKLYFMNSKFEELELSRIKVIGDVVLCQNRSAFKKGGFYGNI